MKRDVYSCKLSLYTCICRIIHTNVVMCDSATIYSITKNKQVFFAAAIVELSGLESSLLKIPSQS